jgi:hypothetical protein
MLTADLLVGLTLAGNVNLSLIVTADLVAISELVEAMADPGPARHDDKPQVRRKHPAWQAMETRLKREFQEQRNEIAAGKTEASTNYLQELKLKQEQVKKDIIQLERRVADLVASRLDQNIVVSEVENDIETVHVYLDLLRQREASQGRLIAALAAAILFYFY